MKLHYSTHGDESKPTIVLIHGFLSDSYYWRKIRRQLSSTHRVITIDLLGFGRSPKPRRADYSLDQHAKMAVETLQPLLDKPAVLVGHSMGALVSARVSQLAPELVERLVLCNMPLYTSPDQAHGIIRRTNTLYRFALYSPAALLIWPTVKAISPRGKLRLGRAGAFSPHHTYQSRKRSLMNTVGATNSFRLLERVTCPAVLICGTYDRAIYRQNVEQHTLPANITLKWVDTGHHTALQRPNLILQELP